MKVESQNYQTKQFLLNDRMLKGMFQFNKPFAGKQKQVFPKITPEISGKKKRRKEKKKEERKKERKKTK